MAEADYKQLISYKLAKIAFDLGWDFVRGNLLDKQMNAVESKHEREGGYNEKLLQKRLAYKKIR